MKTFMDKLNEADNSAVIKEYKIDSTDLKFYKYNFVSALKLRPETSIGFPKNNGLWCEMSKPNNSIITIKTTKKNTVECDICDGTGEHYCSDCECYHECGVCEGTGIINDDMNDDNGDDNILLEDVINLNQGELF